jgi:hypothetical protein
MKINVVQLRLKGKLNVIKSNKIILWYRKYSKNHYPLVKGEGHKSEIYG